MANAEHVEIVRQGIDAVEKWQRANVGVNLDLVRANLAGVNLANGDLVGADFAWANLAKADLNEASLSWADLSWANLTGANLTGANLSWANLTQANLSEANMSEAELWSTIYNNATVNQTQFSGATADATVFADCDLSVALGLESMEHDGPSTIGLDTIIKSGGNIPEVFLQGCGVPDSIITYVRSLVAEPIQFYSCFISFAHQDQTFADRLHADLQAKGVRCWYYPESSIIGRRIWEDIDRSIKVYDKLVVICSAASLNRPAVIREIEKSLEKEDAGGNSKLADSDVLFPIRIDDYVFDGWEHHRKSDVASRTIGDFVGWDTDVEKYQDSLNRLLNALDPKSWPAVG